ncbi:uncharacterized protein LOC144201637 [Stigmatopora nigra]
MAPLEPTCSRVFLYSSTLFLLLAALRGSSGRGVEEASRARASDLYSPASSGPRGRRPPHPPPAPAPASTSSSSRVGRLLVSPLGKNPGASDALDLDPADYQADMPWQQQERPSKSDQRLADRLLKMDPTVECTSDAMKLRVHRDSFAPRPLVFVDRGDLSPLPLSVLPPSCGYDVASSPGHVILVAPYHGCFVTLQEDSFALALLWWGLAMTVTCPLSVAAPAEPPMVTCHPQGMMVKTKWSTPLSDVKINVTGQWELLDGALSKCGMSVARVDQGVLIHVPYGPCVYKKDGTYTLRLAGEQQRETEVSCPAAVQDPPKPGTEPRNVPFPPFHHFPSHPVTAVTPKKPLERPRLPEKDRPQAPATMPPRRPDNHLPSFLFPNPPDGPVRGATPTASPSRFQPPVAPQLPKADETAPSVPPPKRPLPEDRLAVGGKPYYPFLPNPWPENRKDPGPVAGGSGDPTYPQVPEPGKKPGRETGPLNKPYPFLPEPGKKPGTDTDGSPLSEAKPTAGPRLPEAGTIGAARQIRPYLFTFPPDPQKKPEAENPGRPLYPVPDPKEGDGIPSGHPQKPDLAPPPPSFPTPATKEPVPDPQNPGKVPESPYRPDPDTRKLIPEGPVYPLFPVPGLGGATPKPAKEAVRSPDPGPHPPYAVPALSGKPMIPQVDVTDPDPYGFFPKPEKTPEEGNEVGVPHPSHPLFPMPAPEKKGENGKPPTGKVQPASPTFPRPKEAGKKPAPWPVKVQMPVPPPEPYPRPGHLRPHPPYPPYSKPLPKPRPNKAKRPHVVPGQSLRQYFPQYPGPGPGPQEPGKRPGWKPPLWSENKVVGKPAARNPYLVYPTPSWGELPANPMMPEAPGHVPPPKLSNPLPVGPGPEGDVPAKAYGPPEPPTAVNPVQRTPGKDLPLVEETAKAVDPRWRPPPPPPVQGSKTASKMACARFCSVGVSNCCPQITFHQHVYLSPAAPGEKLTRILSRQLPFGPPVAYHPPSEGGGDASIAAGDAGVPAKGQASRRHGDGRAAAMAGSSPKSVALPETWRYPHLLEANVAPSSRRPGGGGGGGDENPSVTGSQLSDHVRPFVVHNPSGDAGGFLKDPAGPRADPRGLKRPGPRPPHDMPNDAEAPKNTLSPWDIPRGNPARMRERTGASQSKGYVLLHRGPPGKEPRGLAGSRRHRNFPARLRRGMGNVGFSAATAAAAADRGALPKWTLKR